MSVTEESVHHGQATPEEEGPLEELWLEERPRGRTIGIGEATPRLSWIAATGIRQVAYEVEIDQPGGISATGRVESVSSRLIPWPGAPLRSRDRATIRIRLWTSDKDVTPWSEVLSAEAGLLEPADWTVDFVSPSLTAPRDVVRPGYLLRSEFTVPKNVTRARVYATAHGIYSLELNGIQSGDDLLSPGWSSYEHRIRYQTHDITPMLTPGRNAIGARLADGWYRGRLGFNGGLWDNYGTDVSLLAQVELTLDDDTLVIVPLEWKGVEGPVVSAGLYEGEVFDARLAPLGWSDIDFDDENWSPPAILGRQSFPATLEAPTGPSVRVTERLRPRTVEQLPDGRIRLDFGQNIAGKLEISLAAPAGHSVKLHHAEVIENGELATRPLRAAPSVDMYISGGRGRETWSPQFTLHGFRYAELENWPGDFRPSDVTALVVHTDMERTGWFESSNPKLNQLHSNIVWSMRGNFVDLPTDCPQRDERLGWTGDIQVFAPTASFIYSVHGILDGWLRDVAAEQKPDGSVPNFVPWIDCGFPDHPAAAWGDAAVIVPWVLYERYGDLSILTQQYSSMKSWVELMAKLSGPRELWNEGFQLGDWLDPAAPPDNPADSTTDKYLVATAYRAHSTSILQKTAQLLGHESDAERYAEMLKRITAAFGAEFVTPNGRLASDTPTAYSLAIMFDLLTPAQRPVAGKRLAELVAQGAFRISTGFVGTPIVCDALVATGSVDVAYHLLLREGLPSWLYPVTMGATTIWERWDSMLPDGSINPGEMTSFNHYAFGAVADFMHRVIGGLAPASPGYATLTIAPQPGGGLTSARAEHHTPYGRASSSWTRDGERFELTVEIPRGCEATITLPGEGVFSIVGAGIHTFISKFRSAENDPATPALFNIHNPEHRAARDGAVEGTQPLRHTVT